MYPPFTYSVLFMQIMRISQTHFNSNYQAFIEGEPFSWKQLTYEEHDYIVTGIEYRVSSALSSFGYLLLDIVFYIFLTWYFDHIFTDNRGVNYSKLFFLKRDYWCNSDNLNSKHSVWHTIQSSQSENESQSDLDIDENYCIVTENISKTYTISQ